MTPPLDETSSTQSAAGALAFCPPTAAQETRPALPTLVVRAGERAGIRFLEFFAANIRNPNTRRAYAHAVGNFIAWCAQAGVTSITAVQPLHVAAWIELQTQTLSAPTVKQHLAAIRHLFDWLVTGQVVPHNPAASVRGPSHTTRKGKTPVLDATEARQLLDSIDVSTPIGLRDRALIAVMVFSFARIGAAIAMKVEDVRGTGQLSTTALPQANAYAMVTRRALAAGLDTKIGNHTFRATGITAYLKNGGTLENAAAMANHASTRTTQLYDRRRDDISLDEVERIRV
jgi:site-specific recombinase XerD